MRRRRGAHYDAVTILIRRAETRAHRGTPARGGMRRAVERDRPPGQGRQEKWNAG
jgi:hypothetical protein